MDKLSINLIENLIPSHIKYFAQPFVGNVRPFKMVNAETIEINEYDSNISNKDRNHYNLISHHEDPFYFINNHNRKNILLYVEPPCSEELLPTGDYEALIDVLLDFKGKVIFVGNNRGIYYRINHYLFNKSRWHNLLSPTDDESIKSIYCNYQITEQLNLL